MLTGLLPIKEERERERKKSGMCKKEVEVIGDMPTFNFSLHNVINIYYIIYNIYYLSSYIIRIFLRDKLTIIIVPPTPHSVLTLLPFLVPFVMEDQ